MPDLTNSNPATNAPLEKGARSSMTQRSIGPRRLRLKMNVMVLLKALQRRWFLGNISRFALCHFSRHCPVVFGTIGISHSVHQATNLEKGGGGPWNETPVPPLQRQTQVLLIKDPLTLVSVIQRPEIAKLSVIREQQEPEEWLQKELRIDFPSPELECKSHYQVIVRKN